MTSDQFNAALVKLGFCAMLPNGVMTKGHVEFARTVEVGERTVRRWASGDWPVPTPIAMLLKLMLKTKTRPEDLAS
jgi:uncharacterized protein (DUF111 family)